MKPPSQRPRRNGFEKQKLKPSELRDLAFRKVILSIPKGKVATYGAVAAAAGYPRLHRAVASFLRNAPPGVVPWQRVVGAGGEIKLRFEGRQEQRLRLEVEGIAFSGNRVDLKQYQHAFRTWELD